MTSQMKIAAIVLGVVVLGGAVYALSSDSTMKKDTMNAGADVEGEMMEKDEIKGETMMEKPTQKDEMVKDDASMMKKGSYEPYAASKLAMADGGDVVIFFRASWCPTCKAVDSDIRAHLGAIPSDLTILDVDYDNSTALKKKYGVTYQHTFVQVAADGTLIKKWSGSPTLDALVAEVQ